MDLTYLIAILVPICVVAFTRLFFKETITWAESAIQLVVMLLVVTVAWFPLRYLDAADTELWNGEITNKEIQRESCPQYWRDSTDSFCTEYQTRTVKDGPARKVCTGSGKDKSCRMEQDYKTQYRYIYPWEQKFFVYTNIQSSYTISRIDAQGARTPPQYTNKHVGDPAAAAKSYTNWIRGAAGNLFHEDGSAEEKYKDILPQYPMAIYDYLNVDRIVTVGNVKVDGWHNRELSNVLKVLGPKKQMNAIIVIADANIASADFPFAVRRFWQGFKKNDAVIFVGVKGNEVVWKNVMSWSKEDLFNVELRNSISDQKTLDISSIIRNIEVTAMKSYVRREMKEFEYLKSQVSPPNWLVVLVLFLSIGGSLGAAYYFHRNVTV